MRASLPRGALHAFPANLRRSPDPNQPPAERLPHTTSFAFALVLTAPSNGDQPLDPRTLFELGYCAGRFGPERVAVSYPTFWADLDELVER